MQPMDRFIRMLEQHPIVALHLATALAALVLGGIVLARRKGTVSHRALGWGWVALMGVTTVASAFIRDYDMPNIAGYTPIHLFTAWVSIALPLGVFWARRQRINAHRLMMRNTYIGACVIAGLFALLPQRQLGQLLWHDVLGWVS